MKYYATTDLNRLRRNPDNIYIVHFRLLDDEDGVWTVSEAEEEDSAYTLALFAYVVVGEQDRLPEDVRREIDLSVRMINKVLGNLNR